MYVGGIILGQIQQLTYVGGILTDYELLEEVKR